MSRRARTHWDRCAGHGDMRDDGHSCHLPFPSLLPLGRPALVCHEAPWGLPHIRVLSLQGHARDGDGTSGQFPGWVLLQALNCGRQSPCDLQTHFTWGVKSARQIWLGVMQQGEDSEQPGLTPNTRTNQGRQGQADRSLLGRTMARYQVSCCSSPVTTHLGVKKPRASSSNSQLWPEVQGVVSFLNANPVV